MTDDEIRIRVHLLGGFLFQHPFDRDWSIRDRPCSSQATPPPEESWTRTRLHPALQPLPHAGWYDSAEAAYDALLTGLDEQKKLAASSAADRAAHDGPDPVEKEIG